MALRLKATLFPALFANVGLTNIIAYSIPVLMFIYPLAIVLVLLGLCDKFLVGRQGIYFWVTAVTLLPACQRLLVWSALVTAFCLSRV